jgi:hypothetical protein
VVEKSGNVWYNESVRAVNLPDKSEFTGSVTRKPKRYTGKKRLRKE